jgi:signal transduction histidine kinase
MSLAEPANRPEEESPAWAVAEKIGREKALAETSEYIAHEIKSAIGPLRLAAKLLYKALDQAEINKGKLVEYARQILEQTAVTYEVVNRYADLTQPLTPMLKLVDVNQLLLESLNEVRAECANKKIEIVIQLGHIAKISVDRELIAQALRNVLRNAIEAMERGGKLTVAAHQEGNQAVVMISDTGPGIKPEHLGRVFEVGFTTKLGKQGVGLGLALARRIIADVHSGQITISNNHDGIGAMVSIKLPIINEEASDGK